MIIHRPNEIGLINEAKKWTLVYGRRKTGKTFLVENYVKYDYYFFVNRDRTILSKTENRLLGYDAFMELLRSVLEAGKTVVVDEFHRLGESFFDMLHSMGKKGRLIALTSTLFLAEKLISEGSPLLGLFYEVRIPIIGISDCLAAVRSVRSQKERMELAVAMREPLVAEQFEGGESARELLGRVLIGSVKTVPALMGEIFSEEERSMSATYEGIIRAVASGRGVSGEIASFLFSRKLIGKDDPSVIQKHMDNLVKMGILSRVMVYAKKKFLYKVPSPLMRIFYYADEKYGIAERKPTQEEVSRIIAEVVPRLVEDAVRESLAESMGLVEAVDESSDSEVDGLLLRFKKPEVGIEVKWRERVDKEDIRRAEASLGRFRLKKRMLFVPYKKGLHSEALEIMSPSDLLSGNAERLK